MTKVVLTEGGIIEWIPGKDITVETFSIMSARANLLAEQLRKEGKSTYFLVDLTAVKSVQPEMIIDLQKFLRETHFDKIARFGASPVLRKFSNQVTKNAGKFHLSKQFLTREEAIVWLKK